MQRDKTASGHINSFKVGGVYYEHRIFSADDDRIECTDMHKKLILTYDRDGYVFASELKVQIGKLSISKKDGQQVWISKIADKESLTHTNLLELEVLVSMQYIESLHDLKPEVVVEAKSLTEEDQRQGYSWPSTMRIGNKLTDEHGGSGKAVPVYPDEVEVFVPENGASVDFRDRIIKIRIADRHPQRNIYFFILGLQEQKGWKVSSSITEPYYVDGYASVIMTAPMDSGEHTLYTFEGSSFVKEQLSEEEVQKAKEMMFK